MTILTGRPEFRTPLLFIVGFIVMFVVGGLTGIMFAGDPVRPAGDRHLLRRRALPLHHLRRGRLPDLRRHVLLVPEGHRADVPRAAGPGQLLADLRRDERSPSSRCTSSGLLGMPRRVYTYPSGLGWAAYNLPRRSAASCWPAASCCWRRTSSSAASAARRPGRTRGGGTLEWTTTSPPPAYNFAVIPKVTSAYPNWDARGPRGGRAAARAGRARARRRARDAGVDDARRRAASTRSSRCRRSRPGRSARGARLARLRVRALAAPGDGRWDARPGGRSRSRLARGEPEEADHGRAPPPPPPNGWWGMAIVIASEATLFGALIATYVYLRFQARTGRRPASPRPASRCRSCSRWSSSRRRRRWRSRRARPPGAARRGPGRLACALVVQAGYLAYQLHVYADDLARFCRGGRLRLDLLHAARRRPRHVAVGLAARPLAARGLARGLTRTGAPPLRGRAVLVLRQRRRPGRDRDRPLPAA